MISHTHNTAAFPLDIASNFKPHLFSGTLLLNCLNKYYAPLWGESRQETYKHDHWSKDDSRLKPFNTLTQEWQWSTPLRNWYDQHDNIIFACSKGLIGVSIDRPEWKKSHRSSTPCNAPTNSATPTPTPSLKVSCIRGSRLLIMCCLINVIGWMIIGRRGSGLRG